MRELQVKRGLAPVDTPYLMPAPRTCRECGSDLPPSVRWCSLCFAPVVELSPRPYVPTLTVEGHHRDRDPAGYWSRWEKSATTMGPRGRVFTTAVILTWLIAGFFTEFIIAWACQLILLSWALKDVWAKGWTIPSAADQPRITLSPEERRSLVPARQGIMALALTVTIGVPVLYRMVKPV